MLAQLRRLWPSLPAGPELQPTLRYDVLPAVVNEYGDAAAALAADWYDTLRDANRVEGTFTATLVDQPGDDMLRAISNWAAAPAEAEVPDSATALARTEGAAQKLVADMHRDTVQVSTERDASSRGWARFTAPDACDFCLMLSARGGVYTSESVRFGSHDHCHCLAGPVWDENHDVVDAYQRSPRSDRQRATQNRLARKWIREHIRGQ
jgi:hypothetical protein